MLIKWTKRVISLAILRNRSWLWRVSCKDYRSINLVSYRNTVILIQGIINPSLILQDSIRRPMIHPISKGESRNFTNQWINLRIFRRSYIKNQSWGEHPNFLVRERRNMKKQKRILRLRCLNNQGRARGLQTH